MLKVLIAEDDLLIADMTEELLADHGYEVCGIGRNVADTLVLARRHKPDLAILDLRLADGDLGTQIADELANVEGLGILYVTGNASAVTSTAVHGHACLSKPYRTSDLLRSLEIISEMIDNNTVSQPFPPNFQVLPVARKPENPTSDNNAARVLTLRRQQSALAGFGSFAMRENNLAAILTEAVRACAEGLRAPFCKIYRYRALQDDLFREAGYGWHAGIASHVVLRADASSPEGRAFVTRNPVISNDPPNRLNADPYAARRTVATVDVIVHDNPGQPFGVLGASNNAGQDHDQNDVDFLVGIADILAGSIASLKRSEILQATIEQLRLQAEAMRGAPDQETVSVEDRPPQATDTIVTVAPANAKAMAPAKPRVTPAAPEQSTSAAPFAGGRSILIVEDDVPLRQILLEHFELEGGFTVSVAGTLAEADQALAAQYAYFDAILLDVRLPDGDGRDFCAKLRREKHALPIIMLTGANDEADIVRGLNSGANDYVAKPYSWPKLFARLRVQLRSFDDSEDAAFRIGPYLFRPAKKLLEDKGRNRRILLTNMETAVLRFLYRWGSGVVARHVLAHEVWGYNSHVTTHTLETHMYRLRQKLEVNPHSPVFLLTDLGGYRLNAGGVRA